MLEATLTKPGHDLSSRSDAGTQFVALDTTVEELGEPEPPFVGPWTIERVHRMPRREGERYEIIDGDLIVTTSPHNRHQSVLIQFAFEIERWNRDTQRGRTLFAPGVIYSHTLALIPDLVWASHERLKTIDGTKGKLGGSPELVVEVVSPGTVSEQRDRVAKLAVYAERDVAEYWIADWQAQTVEVYRRHEGNLALVETLRPGATLASPLLEGFSCAVERLFNY